MQMISDFDLRRDFEDLPRDVGRVAEVMMRLLDEAPLHL